MCVRGWKVHSYRKRPGKVYRLSNQFLSADRDRRNSSHETLMAEAANYMALNACSIRVAGLVVKQMVDKVAILVIDDEPMVTDALMMVLSDRGYEVTVAMTGREGLDIISEQRFDVTITDLRLPDISGLDVLSCVRETHPCGLSILITANPAPEIVAEAIRRGALDVLAKPFSPSDVLNLLEKSLTSRPQKS